MVEVVARRPRVLIIENSLHVTGAFVSAMSIANTARDRVEIEILLPSRSVLREKVEEAGFLFHSLPMSEIGRSISRLLKYPPLLIYNVWQLARLVRRRSIDVLVINDYYNLLGFMLRAMGWKGRLLTYVRLLPANQHAVLNRCWILAALWASDKVVAVSHAVANQLPSSGKIVTLYDPRHFGTQPLADEVGHRESEVRCLYLANYIPGKGHRAALQAFAQAYGENSSLRLRFVGGDMGLEKNAALRRQLEAEAAALGVGKVVAFDGFVADVGGAIAAADMVLNFSESESFSQTCLEACAHGRAVIATRCGGPEEIVDDGISGLLVDVADVRAMSAAILELASDAGLRCRMGRAGARIVRNRFAEEQFLSEFQRLCGVSDVGIVRPQQDHVTVKSPFSAGVNSDE